MLEIYVRWVARNLAVIVDAAVETPGKLETAVADAPPNSVAVLARGETVADITSVTYASGGAREGTITGYIGILTDSTATPQLLDTLLMGFVVQENPIVIQLGRNSEISGRSPRKLWIVNVPRFIPVHDGEVDPP